ncbi:glycosyltransferase family 1 protein [Ceratobasidium sp. AG-Ba]|nr:glycosyltransferase family 1 protein [Ceratobasidium sp. AG-Ba]
MIITDGDKSNSPQATLGSVYDARRTRSSAAPTPGNFGSLDSLHFTGNHFSDNTSPPEYSPRAHAPVDDIRRAAVYDDRGQTNSFISEARPSSSYSSFSQLPTEDVDTKVRADGRVEITFDSRLFRQLPDSYGEPVQEIGIDEAGFLDAPNMNVNIMIVGSRGDVQPYLALGQKLQEYGHVVRLSTHETFRQMVKDAGLRFFNIGGDPHELMSYMVRNPGLVPGFESLRNGDIGRKQKMVAEILERCYQSCIEPDDEQDGGETFAADAIISNPPTFAHIHCAEALGIPLLLSFTMPWCATASFPHPLVNIKQSNNTEPKMANYYSYGLVDIMTWQGLGRTINKFRMKRLNLPYLTTQSAVGMIERCGIPWTYCLSPALVAKPQDWMAHIDVVGFYFLNLARGYAPPQDLQDFLDAGEPPIYIGFGSIVLDDPEQITKSVLGAIAQTGVRALISPGWGGLDENIIRSAGPDVFALGNVPHDWLFEHVSAVVHHGGAGTTAAGLRCGKPTIIVPFFGDQPWWATQIAHRGAGPAPIYPKQLTADALASAIRVALSGRTRECAMRVGEMIRSEDGTKKGVESFHRHLPLLTMRCDLDPKRVAVWYSPVLELRLSAFAAQVLAECPREYNTHVAASDPLTGTVGPAIKIMNDFGRGVAKLPTSRPDKGVAKILEAGTLGGQSLFQSATEGFHNAPRLYGGGVRELGKVHGVGSGLVEGSKGLAYGLYDGFTDMVRQPAKGYAENGIVGAVAGVAIGSSNCVVKPIAGLMAAFSMPLEGAVKDARSLFRKNVGKERRGTRYAEGVVASKQATQAERDVVIKAFSEHLARSWVQKGKRNGVERQREKW